MTRTPTPGPLDSESVKLLVKGDLLRHAVAPNIFRVFRNTSGEWPDLWLHMLGEPHIAHMVDRWLFETRADADGWIPWSGGEQPFADDVRVQVRFSNGRENLDTTAGFYGWEHGEWPTDIIAFRLAPAAPIEASGFLGALTDEQRALALTYTGDDTHPSATAPALSVDLGELKRWVEDYEQEAALDAQEDGDLSHVDDGLREFPLAKVKALIAQIERMGGSNDR